MAISKTIRNLASKQHQYFTLTVNEDRTEDNSSFLSFIFQIDQNRDPGALQSTWDGWGNLISYQININGQAYNGTIPSYMVYTPVTLKSVSNIEIVHNADGTKTIPIWFSVTDNTGTTYTCGNITRASTETTMTLSELHKAPDPILLTITEQNSNISSLIPDSEYIVPFLSNKQYYVQPNLYDSATMVTCNLYYNGQLIDTSSNDYLYFDTSQLSEIVYVMQNNVQGMIVTIEVIDSLGGVGRRDYWQEASSYTKPNLIQTTSNIKRNGQASGKVKLTLNGTFFNDLVGSQSNSITLQFKYWKTTDSEPADTNYNAIPFTPTQGSNDIILSNWPMAISGAEITNVDKSYTYYFKIKATDYFGSSSIITLLCSKGEYVWAEYSDRVDFIKATIQSEEVITKKEVNDLITYSTNEQECGVWIDGNTIYRKVIEYIGNDSSKTIATGITGMSWLVKAYAVALMNTNDIYLPLNFTNSGGWNSFHLINSGADIQYERGTNYKTSKIYFILEYTKQ